MGRSYFILWDQETGYLAANMLAVIPADLSEGNYLTGQLQAGDKSGLDREETTMSVIRDGELVQLWLTERRKLEEAGELEPLPPGPS